MGVSINEEGTIKNLSNDYSPLSYFFTNTLGTYVKNKSTLGNVVKTKAYSISGSSYTGSSGSVWSRTTIAASVDATKIVYSVLVANVESAIRSGTYNSSYYTIGTPYVFILHNDTTTTGDLYRCFTFFTRVKKASGSADTASKLSYGLYPIYQASLMKSSSETHLDIEILNRASGYTSSDIFTTYDITKVKWYIFYTN